MAEPKGRRVTYRVTNKGKFARAKSALDNPTNKARKIITRKTAVKRIRDRRDNSRFVTDPTKTALRRKMAVNKIRRDGRLKVSSGLSGFTKAMNGTTFGANTDAACDETSALYGSVYSAPSKAVNTYNTVADISDRIAEDSLRIKRKNIIRKNYINKAVESGKSKKVISKEARHAVRDDYYDIRRVSDETVKRYKASQKAKRSVDNWRREAAKQRAIANIQRQKAIEAGNVFKMLKYGGEAAKSATKAKIAASIGAVGAGLSPFLAMLVAVIAALLVFIMFFNIFFSFLPSFRGWYSGDVIPTSNLYDAISDMSALYARDIRAYCYFNDVPLPEECTPEWGRTLALWSVLAQHYMGVTGLSNSYGSHDVTYYRKYGNHATGVLSSVYDYSGVLDIADVDTVNGEVYLQPGEYELLYFCFRVIHYDMLKVNEDAASGLWEQSGEWGVAGSWGGMFSRGLPLMRTDEFDPTESSTMTYQYYYDSPSGYCGGDVTALANYPDCPICSLCLDQSRPDWDEQFHNAYHEHRVETGLVTTVSRNIVTTASPRTAMEALNIIHDVSLGRSVEVNGVPYPPSNIVKTYCEHIMVKNFGTNNYALPPREELTGAYFAMSNGSPNCGCSCCVRSEYEGCLYDHYVEMLNTLWHPYGTLDGSGQVMSSNMGWYVKVDGNWEWSVSDAGSIIKPDDMYCVGVLPNFTGTYGPLWISEHISFDAEQMMINQICDAIFVSSQGGAVREVWQDHLIYMAVNCCVYNNLTGELCDAGALEDLVSLGIDVEAYRNFDLGASLTPDTFHRGVNGAYGSTGSAAFTSFNSNDAILAGIGLQDALDWVSGESDVYYFPDDFREAIFADGSDGLLADRWTAPGYQAPCSENGQAQVLNFSPGGHWCAWFVCYLANTNGLFESYHTGMQYQSYYNLLSHIPTDVDTGAGYFCNDDAVNATCQWMLRAFNYHAQTDGSVTVVLRDETNGLVGVSAGDIIFMNPSGTDHRNDDERTGASGSWLPKTNHVGVVLGINPDTGQIITLEGNSGNSVAVHHYSPTDPYLLAYVDIFTGQNFAETMETEDAET